MQLHQILSKKTEELIKLTFSTTNAQIIIFFLLFQNEQLLKLI
jgi:hypothetical protein